MEMLRQFSQKLDYDGKCFYLESILTMADGRQYQQEDKIDGSYFLNEPKKFRSVLSILFDSNIAQIMNELTGGQKNEK